MRKYAKSLWERYENHAITPQETQTDTHRI